MRIDVSLNIAIRTIRLVVFTMFLVLILGALFVDAKAAIVREDFTSYRTSHSHHRRLSSDANRPQVSVQVTTTPGSIRIAPAVLTSTSFAGNEIRTPSRIERDHQPSNSTKSSADSSIQETKKLVPDGLNLRENELDSTRSVPQSPYDLYQDSGWTLIVEETFESDFPTGNWQVFDANGTADGEYFWDDDDYLPHKGAWSAWPANGGTNGVDPEQYYYPNNLRSWMVFGPFDLSEASYAEMAFAYWNQSELNYDSLFWGASLDNDTFYGTRVSGDSGGWKNEIFSFAEVPELGDITGQRAVWICFVFESDTSVVDDGPYLDDIKIMRYFPDAPNLTPDAPSGWTYPIVPSVVTDTHTVDDISPDSTVYIDWNVANMGSDIAQEFDTCLLIDGSEQACWTIDELPFNWRTYVEDWVLGITPKPGPHTLTLVTDINNVVAESNESDNSWSGVFAWGDVDCSLTGNCLLYLPNIVLPAEPAPQLINGYLDQGRAAWSESINNISGRLIFKSGETPYSAHSPEWFVWLGGARNEESRVSQNLATILPTRYPIYVQFHYLIDSAENDCDRDRAEVRVGAIGETLRTVWAISLCSDNTTEGSWRLAAPVNLSLDSLKGRLVTIEMAASMGDDPRNSNFLIDSISFCTTAEGIPNIAGCPATTHAGLNYDQ